MPSMAQDDLLVADMRGAVTISFLGTQVISDTLSTGYSLARAASSSKPWQHLRGHFLMGEVLSLRTWLSSTSTSRRHRGLHWKQIECLISFAICPHHLTKNRFRYAQPFGVLEYWSNEKLCGGLKTCPLAKLARQTGSPTLNIMDSVIFSLCFGTTVNPFIIMEGIRSAYTWRFVLTRPVFLPYIISDLAGARLVTARLTQEAEVGSSRRHPINPFEIRDYLALTILKADV